MAKIKCDKFSCVANLNGECVSDECRGELIQMPPCPCADREKRRKWYEFIRGTFDEDFPQNPKTGGLIMAKYIDADAIKQGIGLHSSIQRVIDSIPAADVRPERHGEWLERNDGGEGFVCGGCNGGYTLYDETPFCPNCGAMMDGKEYSDD